MNGGKLLRTIRLDPSDAFVFPRAAEPGEWAVAGSFLFWERPVETLIGKERAAFRSGLLGIASFGWSTLATIVEVTPADREAAVAGLAGMLLERSAEGAAAEHEIAAAEDLASPPVGTLVALHRSVENGEIVERFRTLLPGTDEKHSRAFSFVAEEGEEPAEERVDLLGLMQTERAP